jgi:hypothetical protein
VTDPKPLKLMKRCSPVALRVALHHADAVADHKAAGGFSATAAANAAQASSSERLIALKHYQRWIT